VRDCLRVSDDVASNFIQRELQYFVGRAANLEGADGVKVFGFEPNLFLGTEPARPGNADSINGVFAVTDAMRTVAARMAS
jgi:hypothetical protein